MVRFKAMKIPKIQLQGLMTNLGYFCSLEMPREGELVKLYDKELSESYIFEVVQVCHETSTPFDGEPEPITAGEIYVANPSTQKESVTKISEEFANLPSRKP